MPLWFLKGYGGGWPPNTNEALTKAYGTVLANGVGLIHKIVALYHFLLKLHNYKVGKVKDPLIWYQGRITNVWWTLKKVTNLKLNGNGLLNP